MRPAAQTVTDRMPLSAGYRADTKQRHPDQLMVAIDLRDICFA